MELPEDVGLKAMMLGYSGDLEDQSGILDWFLRVWHVKVVSKRKRNGKYLVELYNGQKCIKTSTYSVCPGPIVQIKMLIRLFYVDASGKPHGPHTDNYMLGEDGRWCC